MDKRQDDVLSEIDSALEIDDKLIRALRHFEVQLNNSKAVIVTAHVHDSGMTAAGHLTFLTYTADGRNLTTTFNTAAWVAVYETPAADEVVLPVH